MDLLSFTLMIVRVMGVDPGSQKTGYAVVELSPLRIIDKGTIHLKDQKDLPQRLYTLAKEFTKLLIHHAPQELAIETTFFSKNAQSALKLGHVRGVLLLQAAQQGIKIYEYSPAVVKNSIGGNGRTPKDQMAQMIKWIMKLPSTYQFSTEDESDALALCLTHGQSQKTGINKYDRTSFWQTTL